MKGARQVGRAASSERSPGATRQSPLVHQVMFSSLEQARPPAASLRLASTTGERYRLWTTEGARLLIADDYGQEALWAFDSLKPFAYKADLARYCIVHSLGGYYVDLLITVTKLVDPAGRDFIGFRDLNSDVTSWKVANNYFYARAGCPILADCINQVVENVRRRYYGKDPHFPTGPAVLGRSVANLSADLDVLIGHYWWLRYRRNKYTLPNHGVVGRGKSRRWRGGVSGVPGGNNYNELWRARDVYV
ncbi:MAG: hypothetical protein ACP5VR_04050 [Acidimicrobiales bacterium]